MEAIRRPDGKIICPNCDSDRIGRITTRIRLALQEGSLDKKKLSGTVKSDKTFVGRAAKNMHKDVRKRKIKGRGPMGKAIVHGMLERGGKVIAGIAKNQKRRTTATLRQVV